MIIYFKPPNARCIGTGYSHLATLASLVKIPEGKSVKTFRVGKELEVYGDSALIINQVSNKWKTVDPGMQKYHPYMEDLVAQFKEVSFHYLPRDRNRFADALATLASLIEIPEGKSVKPFRVGRRENPAYCFEIEAENEPVDDPWYARIYQYLKSGEASFKNEDGEYKEGIKARSMIALK